MHTSEAERQWFSHLLEAETSPHALVNSQHKERIHSLLARSEVFDNFLQLKFPNLKRVCHLSFL
jgi:probable 2-oxoglutarate dehydrogenase E1 component DHKTD1